MKIIIVGLGQAGTELAKELIKVGHEISVIDINKEIIEEFTNEYDAVGICGNGASRRIQLKAKAGNADLLVALTASDEVNLLACITAKALGARHTIARINDGEYREDESYLLDNLKVDMAINAECDMADEITRLITYPSSIKTGAFSNGKVDIVEIKIKENSPLNNLKITELKSKFNSNVIVTSIVRDNKLIIPRGDAVIKENDEVSIIATSSEIYSFLNKLELIEKSVKSVFIVGCGNIGKYLLQNLSKTKLKIKVVESNKDRCMELIQEFPNIEVVHGDGIDSDTLMEEGIQNFDSCISLTGVDETNLVVTLFAWSCKVRKLITKISSVNYTKMLHNEDIDNTLSPHLVVLSSVHRFIRGIDNKEKAKGINNGSSTIKSLHRFAQNMAEAIEFEITDSFLKLGQCLKCLNIKKDVVIAYIIRNGEIIIPNGETCFEKNDRVVVVANVNKNVARVEEILE